MGREAASEDMSANKGTLPVSGNSVPLGSFDRVVCAHMHVGSIGRVFDFAFTRQTREFVRFGGRRDVVQNAFFNSPSAFVVQVPV